MEYIIISMVALFASGLTLFSGFGLGTLLMPAFALFMPIDFAVAATAVVHAANSAIKAALLGREAKRQVVLRFGLPAIIAAFGGAALLGIVSNFAPLTEYQLAGHGAVITPIKLLMSMLMLVFAGFELLPRFRALNFSHQHLTIGGLLSGFFGGLSGHQGALRSAFLAKAGLSAQGFIGTNAIVGLLVDLARITVYGAMFFGGSTAALSGEREASLILCGIVAAFIGVLIGKRVAKKVTIEHIQTLTGVLLLGIAVALGVGII